MTGFPDFALRRDVGVDSARRCPLRAIRESYEAYWETRANETDPDLTDYRFTQGLVFRVDCNARSTTNTDFANFIAQQRIQRPMVYVGQPHTNRYTTITNSETGQTWQEFAGESPAGEALIEYAAIYSDETLVPPAKPSWQISRSDVSDQGNGTSVVTVSLTATGPWLDADGKPVV